MEQLVGHGPAFAEDELHIDSPDAYTATNTKRGNTALIDPVANRLWIHL
jgi:hypothetical protein